MSLEVFVRATGSAMGLARDSFGFNAGVGTGLASAPGSSATLAAAVSGSGQAVSASNNESTAVDANASALTAQNLAAHAHLDSTLAAAGAGRSQMDSVIAAVLADITSLAPATTTPGGQLDLLNRCVCHLKHTSQILTNGQADASTRAASSAQQVAAFNGLGNGSVGGLAQTPPMALTGAMSPLGGMSSMQNMSMLTAAEMAASQAAMSGAQAASTQQAASNSGVQLVSDVTPMGAKVAPLNPNPTLFSKTGANGGVAIDNTIKVNTGGPAFQKYAAQALQLMGIPNTNPNDPNSPYNIWMKGLYTAAGRESSYNPLAVNNWDSNATGPILHALDNSHQNSSRGLMQTIPSTFAGNHQLGTSPNIYDPIANITAAMNYLHSRYNVALNDPLNSQHIAGHGSLLSISQFNSHSAGGGY